MERALRGLGGLGRWSLWAVGCRGVCEDGERVGGFGTGVSVGLGVLWDR